MPVVGIDDLAIYIPKLYIDYKDFAEARGMDPQKLEYGIGIKKMAIADTNQDSACMAANACIQRTLEGFTLRLNHRWMNQRQ
jgi:hydroxymethylglutaryl-CoA synthase